MPVVPSVENYIAENSFAISLSRYAQVIGMNECQFWGVVNWQENLSTEGCVWNQENRRTVLHHLIEAQNEIEEVLGYPISPRWIFEERQPYARNLLTRWARLIAGGVRAMEVIEAGAVVEKISDLHVISVSTTVTSVDEIFVYHPGTSIQIDPSEVSISEGIVTILVPRCRTVKPEYIDDENIDYKDVTKFADAVDIVRIYNDTSNHGFIYWLRTDVSIHVEEQSIFLDVDNYDIGVVNIFPAIYSDSVFKKSQLKYFSKPTGVLLNYCAGLTQLPKIIEDAIIRLAHSRMADEPCGCDISKRVWNRDRTIPEILTRERLNCPFGVSDGAWAAWRICQKMKVIRLGEI